MYRILWDLVEDPTKSCRILYRISTREHVQRVTTKSLFEPFGVYKVLCAPNLTCGQKVQTVSFGRFNL